MDFGDWSANMSDVKKEEEEEEEVAATYACKGAGRG